MTQRRPWVVATPHQGRTDGAVLNLALCLSAPGSSKLSAQVAVLIHLCHPSCPVTFWAQEGGAHHQVL